MTPEVSDTSETNVTELSAADEGLAPHIGLEYTGCTVGIDAFASPIYIDYISTATHATPSTDLCPCNHSRFQNHLRLRSKVGWFPENQVGDGPNCDLANDVRDTVRQCAAIESARRIISTGNVRIDGILGDISLNTPIVVFVTFTVP